MRAGCLINGRQWSCHSICSIMPWKWYKCWERRGRKEFVQHCLRIQPPLAVIMTKQKAWIVILVAHLWLKSVARAKKKCGHTQKPCRQLPVLGVEPQFLVLPSGRSFFSARGEQWIFFVIWNGRLYWTDKLNVPIITIGWSLHQFCFLQI